MSLTIDVIDKLKQLTENFDKPPLPKVAINLDDNILRGLSGASTAKSTQGDNIAPSAAVNSMPENPSKGRS